MPSPSVSIPPCGVIFQRNPACTACPLHATVNHTVCVPTAPYLPPSGTPLQRKERHDTAVLIVGEAPGAHEDIQGQPFVGPVGRYLRTLYIEGTGLHRFADLYLSNALRCRLPHGGGEPNSGHLKACRRYLLEDAGLLSTIYGEVVILCVGTHAAQQVLGMKITRAFHAQGTIVQLEPEGPRYRVFSTFHPGVLLGDRNPTAIHSIKDHLQLLIDYLKGDYLPSESSAPTLEGANSILVAPEPPTAPLSILSLDIETYGAVSRPPEQTQFHPEKSMTVDGCPREDLIETVALSWPLEDGEPNGTLASAIFDYRQRRHRRTLLRWLRHLARSGGTLIGTNLIFDLLYLRAASPAFRSALGWHSMHLWDLSITSYLHSEARPERSLKTLAPLFGFISYEKDQALMGTYESSTDPRLWLYNCRDSWATLALHQYLCSRIQREYPSTLKLQAYCLQWYSDMLWTVLFMQEAGAEYSRRKLSSLLIRERRAMTAILTEHTFGGKGSPAYIQQIIDDASALVPEHIQERLELTGVHKAISTNALNRHLLLANLEPDTEIHHALLALQGYRGHQKLITSYLSPILYGRGKDREDRSPSLVSCRAFPSWYVVPSSWEAKGSSKSHDPSTERGGTKQGRWSAKRHAIQTEPSVITDCATTRFTPGFLASADLSQIELRIAALLSGDPVMLAEYHRPNPDKHTDTALALFGAPIQQRADFRSVWRQIAKQVNFLALYGGGPPAFRDTVLQKVGIDLPILECSRILAAFRRTYAVLVAWQRSLIAQVKRDHYLELPLIGQSRLFLGGREAVDAQGNEIRDFPVQTLASNVLQSAQHALQDDLVTRRMQTVISCQVHDSLRLDGPLHEYRTVERLLHRHLTDPPFYRDLCTHYDRTVPLDYELKLLVIRESPLQRQRSLRR
jgi:DNA polymerase